MTNKKNLKLFMVNDDPFSLEIYRQHLSNFGFQDIALFDNITPCISSMSEQPHLVLIDYDVNLLSGLVLLRIIKKANPDTHVVFLTGQKDEKTGANLLEYGALDYIVKDEHELRNVWNLITTMNEIKAA